MHPPPPSAKILNLTGFILQHTGGLCIINHTTPYCILHLKLASLHSQTGLPPIPHHPAPPSKKYIYLPQLKKGRKGQKGNCVDIIIDPKPHPTNLNRLGFRAQTDPSFQ